MCACRDQTQACQSCTSILWVFSSRVFPNSSGSLLGSGAESRPTCSGIGERTQTPRSGTSQLVEMPHNGGPDHYSIVPWQTPRLNPCSSYTPNSHRIWTQTSVPDRDSILTHTGSHNVLHITLQSCHMSKTSHAVSQPQHCWLCKSENEKSICCKMFTIYPHHAPSIPSQLGQPKTSPDIAKCILGVRAGDNCMALAPDPIPMLNKSRLLENQSPEAWTP